jgi:hypothetical protein
VAQGPLHALPLRDERHQAHAPAAAGASLDVDREGPQVLLGTRLTLEAGEAAAEQATVEVALEPRRTNGGSAAPSKPAATASASPRCRARPRRASSFLGDSARSCPSAKRSYAFQTRITPEVTFDPMFVPLVRPELIQKAS